MDKTHHTDYEGKLYSSWEKEGLFTANPNSEKPPYSLLMPPPNLTGELHLGHAMQHAILDAIARIKRMQEFDVLLLPGVDHAGIQFEGTLDRILAKEGLSKQKLGREKWLERAWKFKEEVYQSFHKAWTVIGLSADWPKEVFTLEPKVEKAVFEQFKRFWDQDLLYKGAYIVQWCPKCGTAIEDIEMEYEERKQKLYYINYPIQDSESAYITIATTRPETIYADTGIAISLNHPRFKKYLDKKAINPLTKDSIPIFEDKRVEPEFGTGALKITPGHDPLDYEIGKNHNLPILHAIDKTGRTTELAQELAGMKIEGARELAAKKLEELGAIEKIEDYTHAVPVCERCKTTVEPLISEEWFVKMQPLAEKGILNIGQINFYPTNYKKILTDWMENIHDWSISRSLWWGHRIPVWYCQKCNPQNKVGKNKEMLISLEKPEKPCKTGHSHYWIQDEQVLDTWFSSGLWPLSTLGWPEKTKELERYFPWDFEISAGEIKYLWIARMIMLSLWHTDTIPFKHMFFHGMLRDLQGRKFSKSLGNGIDPQELIKTWGTDATRMALYTYSAPGRDGRTSKSVMDNRCKNFRNFGNKLRNIAKFVIELKPENSSKKISVKNKDDQWILKELHSTIEQVTKNIEKFELHLATEELYNFVWHKFADIYIEKSKSRRPEAQSCLTLVLDSILRLLHPFMPFLTEELWTKMGKEESITLAPWPTKT
ncbi:MAG: valine--tRNA ligase [Candidatus Blackburnbacteria bacterium]|nr:valine--tRNA ligase [Candidatus Blackburnbacteria bacterium]